MRHVLWSIVVLAALGCAGTGRQPQDDALLKLTREISLLPPSDTKQRMEALVADLRTRSARFGASGEASRREEIEKLAAFVAAASPVRIEIGFAANGKDWTGDGIDDGIDLYFTPHDSAGSGVKCPGSAEVCLVDTGGVFAPQRIVDTWVVSTDTLRISWNEGPFPAYVLPLPWHGKPPAGGSYELVVDFTPLYGQMLSAKKTVDVHAP